MINRCLQSGRWTSGQGFQLREIALPLVRGYRGPTPRPTGGFFNGRVTLYINLKHVCLERGQLLVFLKQQVRLLPPQQPLNHFGNGFFHPIKIHLGPTMGAILPS